MSEQPPAMTGDEALENALARTNKAITQLGEFYYDFRRTIQCSENRLDEARRCLSAVWQERQALLAEYFDLVRALADLRDRCAEPSGLSMDAEYVREYLDRVLTEHGLEYFEVGHHEGFDPARHECAELTADDDAPVGAVVGVLARGLVKKDPAGRQSVVRAARVVVNKGNGRTEESTHVK